MLITYLFLFFVFMYSSAKLYLNTQIIGLNIVIIVNIIQYQVGICNLILNIKTNNHILFILLFFIHCHIFFVYIKISYFIRCQVRFNFNISNKFQVICYIICSFYKFLSYCYNRFFCIFFTGWF